MKTRVIGTLFVCGLVAFACGPRTRSSESSAPTKTTVRQKKHTPVTAPLVADLAVNVSDEVRFAFAVTNASTKGVEIDFPSSQTHDFAVLDSAGAEVWRWSRTRMFTSALLTKPLGSDDGSTFADSWSPEGRHGRFTVIATLESSNYPLEQRAEFTLR
jgi:intracellular proteinase inhibitor BsuPI